VRAFVAVGIQHAVHLHPIVICGLPVSAIFFHIVHKWHDFQEKVIEREMCVLIFSTTFV
jgi:hypothetical protein